MSGVCLFLASTDRVQFCTFTTLPPAALSPLLGVLPTSLGGSVDGLHGDTSRVFFSDAEVAGIPRVGSQASPAQSKFEVVTFYAQMVVASLQPLFLYRHATSGDGRIRLTEQYSHRTCSVRRRAQLLSRFDPLAGVVLGDVLQIFRRRCSFGVHVTRPASNRKCGMCWMGWR